MRLPAPPRTWNVLGTGDYSHGSKAPWTLDTFTPSGAPGNPVSVEILFIHAAKGRRGVLPGAKNCDGKGLDNFEARLGG
ncbi:hypothetical protein [Aeromicrobium sp.]|uniref:hypothetical protein n=1 Tax=Aeromicrobium sp. TaxID=1871063 RepID=UPI003C3B1A0A